MNATTTTDIPDCPMRQKPGPCNHRMPRLPKNQDHLNDTTTYKSLTTSETDHYLLEIKKQILAWLKTYNKKLTKMERAFIWEELKSNQTPYARFYLM